MLMKSRNWDNEDNMTLETLKSIKSPHKFSKISRDIDRVMKNFSIEKIKEKLTKKVAINFSFKGYTRVEEINRKKKPYDE
jgi:hypothetical protein